VRRIALLAVLALAFGAAGCGGDDEVTPTTGTETTTTEPAGETTSVSVYWLREGKVWPALREVEATEAVATPALEELLEGPTTDESRDFDFTTSIPDGVDVHTLDIADGVATVHLSDDLDEAALAQVVHTLTRFPTVESVAIQDGTYTRADFEGLAPAILVESPRFFEEVGNPVRVTGTANTFEATFEYELTDTDGRIVDDHFVTATSGTGTRGTFDFTTAAYEIPFDGVGALIVFERSAKDGSRINLVEIPVRMTR
jgi:hypothetical protein